MVRSRKTETTDGRLVRSAAWIDRKLMPVFGAPPVSTDERAREGGTVPSCPVCGHPMGEHSIDHSTPNALLECPAPIDHSLERDDYSPLDELGMPVREPRKARTQTR